MSRPLALVLPLLLAGAGLPHAQGICTDSYTVIQGDTLYSIARLCRSSVAAMARANLLADVRSIEPGQRLIVPGRAASVRTFRQEVRTAPVREERGYRMGRGDTLYSLARWTRVSLGALLAVNPGIDPSRIGIGDLVRLPEGARDPARGRPRVAPPTPEEAEPEARDEPDVAGM